MRLLVSVATASDALAALDGGAAFIDAKNPSSGPLGAVSEQTFADICDAVAGRRPITAALGDASDDDEIEAAARSFARAGATLVKVGFAGIASVDRVDALLAAALRGAQQGGHGGCGVVAVAYADAPDVGGVAARAWPEVAARNGATGVLLDTADKAGPGLRDLMTARTIESWIAESHQRGLLVALAGKLTAEDLPVVRDWGADVAGVRGAACDHGRDGRVSAARVRLLRAACQLPDCRADDASAPSIAATSSAATMMDRTWAGSALGK